MDYIHTAQGLEFDYAGVLIGKDLRFDEDTGWTANKKPELISELFEHTATDTVKKTLDLS